MKDLKHLIYLENLLLEANNELIAQAQKEGQFCIGYTCENVPEPLLNLAGVFSVRLRAPRTGSMSTGNDRPEVTKGSGFARRARARWR